MIDGVHQIVDALEWASLTEDERLRWSLWDQFIEESLSQIAKYYESEGLIAPKLPVRTIDGVKKYVVYVYDYHWSPKAESHDSVSAEGIYYPNICRRINALGFDPFPAYLTMSDDDFMKYQLGEVPGETVREIYNIAAHELFHAVQFAYDEAYSSILRCEGGERAGGDAVIEGTATAAAVLATLQEYPGYLSEQVFSQTDQTRSKDIGVFPYGIEAVLEANMGTLASPYLTSSFWRYLTDRFGGLRVFDTLFRTRLRAATLEARYDWLDRSVKSISAQAAQDYEVSAATAPDDSSQAANRGGSPLYTVFPEFAAEFGSYVVSRYGGDHYDWLHAVFRPRTLDGNCRKVEVTDENNGYAEVLVDFEDPLFANSITCIDLRWRGLPEPSSIEVEAIHKRSEVLDQLHLGIAYLLTNDTADWCYEALMAEVEMGRIERHQGDCSYGKVFPGSYSANLFVKRWGFGWQAGRQPRYRGGGHFFSRALGSGGRATLTLTNMSPKPFQTDHIPTKADPDEPLILRFSRHATDSNDGRRFQPVDFPDMTGSLSGPSMGGDRYSGYGVDPDATRLPGGGLASFGLREVGQSNTTFSVTLVGDGGPLQFGETGPVHGNVVGKVSGLTAPMSGFCAQGGQRPPIGRVEKSDEEQLRITIDTDLCRRDGGGVTVVDHVAGEVILPFGRRYFPSTAPVDVITPGLEIYIDEYYKDLAAAGVPVPDSFLGGGPVVPGDDGGPSEAASPPGTKPSGGELTGGQAACECSCEEFEKLQEFGEALDAGDADVADIQVLAQCTNTCMPQYMRCAR